ncbi:unnamed protein product [Schistosoma margrebowiei]|uniref:Uncharacterized protein n=1 Tax=Schistosoma margrebowiei TaxID=48269 RepID=A0A183MM41_9TREM|nr:unnamed protein product [Schistosoma margrebowiei]
MVVGGSQQETLDPGFVLLGNHFGRPNVLRSDGFRTTPPPPAYSSLKHITQPPPSYSEIQSINDLLAKQCVNTSTSITTTLNTGNPTEIEQSQLESIHITSPNITTTTTTTNTNSPPSYSEVVLSRSNNSNNYQISDSNSSSNTNETDTTYTSNLDTSSTITN